MYNVYLATALVLLAVAAVCDFRRREVPDWIAATPLLLALAAAALGLRSATWSGLALGFVAGCVVAIICFYVARLGGGDATLIAALGAALGPIGLFVALFWMAMAGAVLAIVAAVRRQRTFAYAPAIAIGTLIYVVWPGVLGRILAP